MDVKIEPGWKKVLATEFEDAYFKSLTDFVKTEYASGVVYPPPASIFRAFDLTPFEKVKVVILGQDPYHGLGQANGLAFAVNTGVSLPPSLVNVYKEIETDLGVKKEAKGDLENWARQGVLMLNATLTVRAAQAGSHQKKGWELFTDAVIRALSQQRDHLVFILWGNYAQKKGALIDEAAHMVIKSAHPSPLSAYNGFFGSKPFSQCNSYLIINGQEPITW